MVNCYCLLFSLTIRPPMVFLLNLPGKEKKMSYRERFHFHLNEYVATFDNSAFISTAPQKVFILLNMDLDDKNTRNE